MVESGRRRYEESGLKCDKLVGMLEDEVEDAEGSFGKWMA